MNEQQECRRYDTGWLCVVGCTDPAHDEFLTAEQQGSEGGEGKQNPCHCIHVAGAHPIAKGACHYGPGDCDCFPAEQQGSDESGEGLSEVERDEIENAWVISPKNGPSGDDDPMYAAVERILADRLAAVQAERQAEEDRANENATMVHDLRARLAAVEALADDLCDFHGGHGDYLSAGKSLRAALANPSAAQGEGEVPRALAYLDPTPTTRRETEPETDQPKEQS